MKKVIGTISKVELDAMIAEEYSKMKKVMALKKQKESLQEEIKRLKEEHNIEEVKASGHKDKGEAYYMKGLPVQDFEEKKNGSEGDSIALKEDINDMDDDMDIEIEMEPEMGAEMEDVAGEFELLFKELGKKLDQKMCGESDEIDSDLDSDLDSELSADLDTDSDEVEVEVEFEDDTEEDTEEEIESLEEQDGDTVVNAADQDDVNPNMKKVDNDNPMADKLYEGVKKNKSGNLINPNNNPIINEELDRMRKLAKLI